MMKCYRMVGFVFAASLACLTGTVRAEFVPGGEFNASDDVLAWSCTGPKDWIGNGEAYASPDGKSAAFFGVSWFYRPGCTTGPAFVAGQQYEMSFLATAIAGPNRTLQAGITTGSGDEHNTPFELTGVWQPYSVTFTATEADVAKSFQPQFLGADGTWFGIDNVAVNAIPEPSTLMLLGAGLLGLLAYAWRKRT